MTIDDARSVYLSLPGAEEGQHHGHPDFRIGGKIFATLQPERDAAVLRLPLDLAEALAADQPVWTVVSRVGGMGWLRGQLAQLAQADFEPLAETAFELRRSKPKR